MFYFLNVYNIKYFLKRFHGSRQLYVTSTFFRVDQKFLIFIVGYKNNEMHS
jgi:hypothetical protein